MDSMGSGSSHRIGLPLIHLDQGGQQFRLIPLGRAGPGLEDFFETGQGGLVFGLRFNELGFHQMISALILLYWAWVPTKRMKSRPVL